MKFADDFGLVYAGGPALLTVGIVALMLPLTPLFGFDLGMTAKDLSWLLAYAPAALVVSAIVLGLQRRLDQE